MKITALLAMSLACSVAMAQADTQKPRTAQPPKVTTPAQPSENDMMMAMMAAGQPNENHALLAKCAGTWTATCKFRMTPDAPWQESKGTMKSEMVFGGRFLKQAFTGDFGGMPFEGMGMMGYNNVTKQFEATWFDSMNTGATTFTGTYDASKKAYTMSGECCDPMDPTKKRKSRSVMTHNSPDKMTEEMFEIGDDGKAVKNMEIVYTSAGTDAADHK
jgi:hypothetical protein